VYGECLCFYSERIYSNTNIKPTKYSQYGHQFTSGIHIFAEIFKDCFFWPVKNEICCSLCLSVIFVSSNYNNTRSVILGFGDSTLGQYTMDKPILDKYGFKGTFFTVCNYMGTTSSRSISCTVIFELSLFFFTTLFAFVARLSSFGPPAIWEVCFYAMLRSFYALFSYGSKLYAFRSPIVGDHGGYLISLVLNALSTSRRERGSKLQ
jgi:hypothetical protein